VLSTLPEHRYALEDRAAQENLAAVIMECTIVHSQGMCAIYIPCRDQIFSNPLIRLVRPPVVHFQAVWPSCSASHPHVTRYIRSQHQRHHACRDTTHASVCRGCQYKCAWQSETATNAEQSRIKCKQAYTPLYSVTATHCGINFNKKAYLSGTAISIVVRETQRLRTSFVPYTRKSDMYERYVCKAYVL
jgi:hypothetical protein